MSQPKIGSRRDTLWRSFLTNVSLHAVFVENWKTAKLKTKNGGKFTRRVSRKSHWIAVVQTLYAPFLSLACLFVFAADCLNPFHVGTFSSSFAKERMIIHCGECRSLCTMIQYIWVFLLMSTNYALELCTVRGSLVGFAGIALRSEQANFKHLSFITFFVLFRFLIRPI